MSTVGKLKKLNDFEFKTYRHQDDHGFSNPGQSGELVV